MKIYRQRKWKKIINKNFKKNKKKRISYINLIFKNFCILFLFIGIFVFNHIKKNHKLQNNIIFENNKSNKTQENKIIKETHIFKYYCCFCSMGKKENLYSRELISYYMSLGVEKFVFGDNNLPNTEKLEDVLQDYIKNGTVDIIDIIGNPIGQSEFYGIMYEKYKEKCKWLTFFDFDEYLEMHFEKGKNILLKEYLSNPIFENCEAIEINWLMYGDNDLVYYDNRTSIERFTIPDYENYANRFVKSIIRGKLNKKVFKPGETHHQPYKEVKACDSLGKPAIFYPDCIIPPRFNYAYLKHFNTKTADEYADKIKRGYPGNHYERIDERIELFFKYNEFTKEKLKVFEKKFNRTFLKYHGEN